MLIVIDPGVHTPEKACWNLIQNLTSLPIETYLPALEGWENLQSVDLSQIQGVVILGSGASPADPTLEWQFHLIQWLESYMSLKKPLLGICYGHQLLAYMEGGGIDFLSDLDQEHYPPEAKESGLRDLWFTPQELEAVAFAPSFLPSSGSESSLEKLSSTDAEFYKATQLKWVVSHREVVSTLPPSWNKYGFSTLSHLGVEVMKHETYPWWGVQAHIEAVDSFLVNNQVQLSTVPSPYDGHLWLTAFLQYCEDESHLEKKSY